MSQDLNMGKAQAHAPTLKFKPTLTTVFYCENRYLCFGRDKADFGESTGGGPSFGGKT